MPKICCKKNTKILRSFKNLYLCNKFLKKKKQKQAKFNLKLSQCRSCGLLQLNRPLRANMIAQEHEWIRYYEPEDHLPHLSSKIKKACKFSKKSVIAGITYKDDSLIKHLKKKIGSKSWRIKPKKDLKIKFESAASETVLPKINSKNVLKLATKYGKADLLVGRHILEHAPSTFLFLNQLKKLVKKNGYILFEVPDCSKQIRHLDYTMLWEEHNLYFTPEILKNYFKINFPSMSLVKFFKYKYPIENALLILLKNDHKKDTKKKKYNPRKILKITDNYSKNFNIIKNKIHKKLKLYKNKYGKIAIFGAGHISIMFINLFNIGKYINFVIDDNANKQKHLMPGSKLPIKKSSALIDENIKLCLMSLNPNVEKNVIRKNKNYLEKGGKFVSIFPYYKSKSIYSIIK